jgi:hypothetical protein
MRMSIRSKVSIFGTLTALVVLVGGFALYGMTGPKSPAHAASATSTYQGTRGQLQRVGTVNPLALPRPTKSAQAQPKTMPLRMLPGTKTTSNGAKGQPSASGLPLSRLNPNHNFNGVDEITNDKASGTPLEPPDEGLGVGDGVVFNIVNVTGAFYKPNGTLLAPPFAANAFFGESPTAFTSDPRTYFDASTNTWFATILEGDFTNYTESHFDLAVNTSGNPLSPWTVYRIDTTDSQDNGCPCFGDYPEFGIDQFNVYVTTNEFPLNPSTPVFNGAQIYAISKSQLESLSSQVNYVHFEGGSVAGTITYHVQPAISYTNPNAEFFMESLDPNGTFDNRLAIWAMTDRKTVTSGQGMPNLSSTVITGETYGFPVNAQTPPGYNGYTGEATTGVVTPDFDAMQEVEYINGHLDGALDTAVTIPGDTSTRDGAAWFQVNPVLKGDVISSNTSVTHQGYVDVQGEYLLYPHINENASGFMAMTFTLGGPNTYLSAAYAVKPASNSQFKAVHLAAAGAEPDNGFTDTAEFGGVGRWGDYSNGEVDTSGNIWLATEYIPNNGDQYANWGNRIFEILAN